MGQSFVYSDSERRLLHDEDHSGSRPHSLPGLSQVGSGISPERIRSGFILAGSEETHKVGIEHLKSGSPSY